LRKDPCLFDGLYDFAGEVRKDIL